MPSIKNTLLGLATVTAVAYTGNDLHVNADLTKFDAMYDGATLNILATVGEIEILVDTQKNSTFKAEFVVAKNKILNQASIGVLTPQAYACFMYTFYKSANVAYQDFSGYVAKNLPNVQLTTEKYYKAAPMYWWDFYADKLATVAAADTNEDLTNLFLTFDSKVEADITNQATIDTVNSKIATFLKSADALVPTYSTKVSDAWNKAQKEIAADFNQNANCPGVTLPPVTPTTTTVTPAVTATSATIVPAESPSPTTATTSASSEATPAPTEATAISIEIVTPAPTAAKVTVTTTAPTIKSSASKLVSTVASAVLVVMAFAVGFTA